MQLYVQLCACACTNDRNENGKDRKQQGSLSHQHRKLATTERESMEHLHGVKSTSFACNLAPPRVLCVGGEGVNSLCVSVCVCTDL